ncbi:prepilin peptidase [Candidatus Woesearchaeota archaeon]|nr:prepilin peptidase [Candidatus Woesearchaeota archaeon]
MKEIILLSLFFIFGIYLSYYDHKHSKIPNKAILLGLLSGLITHIIFFDIFVFLNLFISTIIGFLLWKLKFWSAGDGKLFILISFLIPLNYYPNQHYEPLTLLINSFFPIFLFLLIMSLFKIKKLKFEKFEFWKLILSFTAIIGFSYLFNYLNIIKINKFIVILLILFLLKKTYYYIGSILFLVSLFFFELELLYFSFMIFCLFYGIRFLIKNISNVFSDEVVHFAKYLFLGGLLTILLKNDIISSIINLFFN